LEAGNVILACLASLLRLPFLRKSKLVAREQGPCAEKASAGKEFAQEIPPRFRKMRRAPLQRINLVFGKRTACPPDPENDWCLMVFTRKALAFGPGNGRNSIGFTTIPPESDGG